MNLSWFFVDFCIKFLHICSFKLFHFFFQCYIFLFEHCQLFQDIILRLLRRRRRFWVKIPVVGTLKHRISNFTDSDIGYPELRTQVIPRP
jgi:hypothetical protein